MTRFTKAMTQKTGWMVVGCLTLGMLPITAHADKPEEKEPKEQPSSLVEVRGGASIQVYQLGEEGEFVLIRGDAVKVPKEVRDVLPKLVEERTGGPMPRAQIIGSVTTVGPDGKVATTRLRGDQPKKLPAGLPKEVTERLKKAQKRIQEANREILEAHQRQAVAQKKMLQARESLKKLAAEKTKAVERRQLDEDLQKAVSSVEVALTGVGEALHQVTVTSPSLHHHQIQAGVPGVPGTQLPQEVRNQVQVALLQKALAEASKKQAKNAGMEAKLDEILSRLNKLEAEVTELRSE